jgi:hypothetical protein
MELGRVIGIGGVFFKSDDHAALREWYARNFGIECGQHGAAFKWRSADEEAREHSTAWGIFPRSQPRAVYVELHRG